MLSLLHQGSWSKAISDRLKNMRRKPRAERAGLEFAPPVKKRKIANHGSEPSGHMLDDTSYQRHLSALNKELKKTVKNRLAIRSLVSEMAPNRRQWIMVERPAVHEVLEMYPPLKDSDVVSISTTQLRRFTLTLYRP